MCARVGSPDDLIGVNRVYAAGMSRLSKSLIRESRQQPGCNIRLTKIWFIHHVGIIDQAEVEVAHVPTSTND